MPGNAKSQELNKLELETNIQMHKAQQINAFLRASAMLKHVIDIGWTSVRPSVRPSHAGIVSKRLNILSCFLRYTIARSF